jgi:hypothetical protein
MLTIKKEQPTRRGGMIFNPSGMTLEEYRQKLEDSGSSYMPMSEMEKLFNQKSKKKQRQSRKFKDGGLVSGKAQAKKYFKGVF